MVNPSLRAARREVFPIPVVPRAPGLVPSFERAESLCDDASRALNELFSGSVSSSVSTSVASPCQLSSRELLLSQATRMADSFDVSLDPKSSFESLGLGVDYRGNSQSFVALDENLLSLPASDVEPQPVSRLLGPRGDVEIEDFKSSSCLPIAAGREASEASGLVRPFMDPGIRRCSRRYHNLLRKLEKHGILCYGLEAISFVGMFAVNKKSGKQRLVIDCRLANLYFRAAKHVNLPTASSFARIEVEVDETLFISQFDLSCAFYQMLLPEFLRPYFCLEPVKASAVGVSMIGGSYVSPDELIFPQMKVMPMGFSHALYFCQRIFENIVRTAIPLAPLIHDSSPVPPLERGAAAVYVDNFASMSTDPAVARDNCARVVAETHARGLTTHEHDDGAACDLLGVSFCEGNLIVPKGGRRWVLYFAITHALTRNRLTSRELNVIVGHFTFLALLRREMLSVMSAVYSFIAKGYAHPSRLWPAVRRELTWMRALLCALEVRTSKPWASQSMMFDASPWGAGVMRATVDSRIAADSGRFSERWRFKSAEPLSLRLLSRKAIVEHVFKHEGTTAARLCR